MLKIYLNLHGFFITFVFLPRLEKNLRENFISHVHGLVYIKIETLTQVFPVSFSKFSRTYFSQITSGQLLLQQLYSCYKQKQLKKNLSKSRQQLNMQGLHKTKYLIRAMMVFGQKNKRSCQLCSLTLSQQLSTDWSYLLKQTCN